MKNRLNNIEKFELLKEKTQLEAELHKTNFVYLLENNSITSTRRKSIFGLVSKLSINGYQLYNTIKATKMNEPILENNTQKNSFLSKINWLGIVNKLIK